MKKTFIWIIRIAIVLLFLVAILALSLKFFVDPNDYKEEIQTSFEDTIGRSVEIKGNIEWSLFPWLAIELNDIKVVNQDGFKGDSIAEIKQFAARVKILPLLSKNIEIGRVVVDEGVFNLQVSKRGESNWQSILDHLDSQADVDSKSEEATNASIKVEGVEFKNISLNYKDAGTKTVVNLTDLNLKTGTISSGESVNMDVKMKAKLPDSGMELDVSTSLMANNLLSENGIEFIVDDLELEGALSAESKMPLLIKLIEGAKIDLSKDTLMVPKLSIDIGKANLVTNINGVNISDNMQLTGSYQMDSFDFNQFMTQLTGSPLVSNDAFADFNSRGKWLFNGARLKLDELELKYSKTMMKGNVDINNLDRLKGKFNLHVNQFNVDDFLGDESSSSGGNDKADSNELNFGQLSGNVKIDRLTASGTTMDNITMNIQTNRSKMSILPVRADFYNGLLNTEILIDTKALKERVKLEHKMEKIQAGPLLTDLMGSELLTGLGHFDMNVKIDKPFSEMPLKTAHGKLDFSLGDGAIYGVDVFGMINKGLSLLYPEVMEAKEGEVKKTNFALMQFIANIDQGILTSETLKLESPYLKIDGNISINLFEQTIKGTIEPMLVDIPDELVSEKYKKLLNLPIPVSLSGSLLEPKIKIDPAKLLLATQRQKIDKEKDKLKGKLLESLFGKDKKNESEEGN